jgi:hypothetical protein
MAFFTLPGPLCVTSALPLDAGTLVRASTPPPGSLGTNAERAGLSDYERDLIQEYAGRDYHGTLRPLGSLLRLYEEHVRRHEEAASHFGVQSGAARFEQATVERLADLIAEAQSPRGRASEKLQKLLESAKGGASPATDEQFSQAVAELLDAERQRQLLGLPDSTGQHAMELIPKVLEIVNERRTKALKVLIEDAKRPDSKVTEEQLSKAVADKLGIERQRQLLGVADDDTSGGGGMELIPEVLEIVNERRTKALKVLIEDAKRPDSKVTEEQLSKAVADKLGIERQRQLLGVADDDTSGGGGMELILEALAVSHEHRKAALKSLIEKTKIPGNTITKEQTRKAVADVLLDERQRQLLGSAGPDSDDQEISDLLGEAVKLFGEREESASGSPGGVKVDVVVGPIQILRRLPSRR